MWHEITVYALHSRATNIHIEAGPQETLVRIRIDGALELQSRHPIDLQERLITHIKILARLDIAEKRLRGCQTTYRSRGLARLEFFARHFADSLGLRTH